MIVLASFAVFMAGLVILGLIIRDTRLRMHAAELAERRRELTQADQDALVGIGRRIEAMEGAFKTSVKDHHDRILALERRQPAPRRA